MANILNSALTGDADFAGTIFGSPSAPETQPEPTTNEQDSVETNEQPETQKAEVAKEEKKVTQKEEPKAEKKSKTTKEQVEKAVETATKQVSSEKTKEQSDVSSDSSDSDLPTNPHFADKQVAEKPEGDDSEKGISSWKEIKSEMKKAREERDRLKAELDATKEKIGKYEGEEIKGLQGELEDYKTRIAELSRELKAANFERSPEYVENIKKPLAGLQGDLKAIAEANDSDYSKLWNAIAEPDVRKRAEALEDLIGDFKRIEQLEVVKMAEKYHNLAAYHNRFQQEAETLSEQEAARKAQAEQEFIENDQRLQKAFTAKTWTNLEDRYTFLKEIEGQDDWNNHIRSAKKNAAEANLDRMSVEDRSSVLARAAVVPFLESAINHYSSQLEKVKAEKDSKIKELQAQLDGFVGATPSLGKASESEIESDDEDVDSFMNFGKTLLGSR